MTTVCRSRRDAADELVELERHEATVGAELDDVAGDLLGDPAHHLQALHHRRHVAHRDEVLDLQRGERAADLVEPRLVALERRQCLVGAGLDDVGGLEHVADAADVERDDLHRLAHRDHGEPGLLGHAFGCAVPGAGLGGLDGRVRQAAGRRP